MVYNPGSEFTISPNGGWGPRPTVNGGIEYHPGIDYAASEGATISAALLGTVWYSGENSTYGNTVILQHVENGNTFYTLYAHMNGQDMPTLNTTVQAGAPIGQVGDTGGLSNGNHLHYEVIWPPAGVAPANAEGGPIGLQPNWYRINPDLGFPGDTDVPPQSWWDQFSSEMQGLIDSAAKLMQLNDLKQQVIDALRQAGGLPWSSPIVLDLSGDGIQTTAQENGVYFDHDADGFRTRSSWVEGNDGLLALDLNGNGYIDNGRELFGDNTRLSDDTLADNGYQALAQYDSNHDGVIDASDDVYQHLRVWVDANHDGFSETGELKTLPEAGVASLSLNYHQDGTSQNGSELRYSTTYTDAMGVTHATSDIYFANDRTDTVASRYLPVTEAIAALPDIFGTGEVRNLQQAMAYDDSGVLQSLVTQYVSDFGNAQNQDLLDQIIFKWAGTDGIPAGALAGNMNMRKLRTLEAFQGFPYSGHGGLPSANAINNGVFNNLRNYIEERLIRGSFLADFYNSQVYDVNNKAWLVSDVKAYFNSYFTAKFASDDARAMNELNLFIQKDYLRPDAPAQFEFNRNDGSRFAFSNVPDGIISGIDGDDVIYAMSGNQTIYGGAGNDAITVAGAGSNTIDGGAGDDAISAVGDINIVSYGSSANRVVTTTSSHLNGGEGNDIIQVSSLGNNLLEGGAGDDTLMVGTDEAWIAGWYDSINTFVGGPGNDTLQGSAGTDTYVFNRGDGQDTILDNPAGIILGSDLYGNPIQDTVQFGMGISATDLVVRRSGDNLVMTINDPANFGASDQITIKNWFVGLQHHIENFSFADGTVLGINDIETLLTTGTAGDDVLMGSGDNGLIFRGLEGNDTIISEGGNSTFVGGPGNDTMIGSADSDTYVFNRGDGQDTIFDNPMGIAMTNDFLGHPIQDTVQFGTGIAQSDLTFSETDSDLTIGINDLNNAAGNDRIVIQNWFTSPVYRVETFSFTDGSSLSQAQVQAIVATINGTDGDDVLTGWYEDNTINAFDGNDVITDDAGDNTINAGAGNDVITTGSGSDRINAGIGDDTITDTGGDNTIIAGAGDDTVTITGWGDNTIDGGEGNDTVMDNAPGNNTITGGAGDDMISTVGAWTRWGGMTYSHVSGGEGNDRITVSPIGDNLLEGGAGDDILRVTQTRAFFGRGDAWDSWAYGVTNTFAGGAGNDILQGSSSTDIYVFNRGDGQDTIIDNPTGANWGGHPDTVRFGAEIAPLDLAFSRNGDNLVISEHGSTDSVTVENWYAGAVYQTELIKTADGSTLVNTQVDQLIQAMAAFSANNGGITWDQAIAQRPEDVQAVLAANWQPPAA